MSVIKKWKLFGAMAAGRTFRLITVVRTVCIVTRISKSFIVEERNDMKYSICITMGKYVYSREFLGGLDPKKPIVRASDIVAELLESLANSSELTDQTIEVRFLKTETAQFRE